MTKHNIVEMKCHRIFFSFFLFFVFFNSLFRLGIKTSVYIRGSRVYNDLPNDFSILHLFPNQNYRYFKCSNYRAELNFATHTTNKATLQLPDENSCSLIYIYIYKAGIHGSYAVLAAVASSNVEESSGRQWKTTELYPCFNKK